MTRDRRPALVTVSGSWLIAQETAVPKDSVRCRFLDAPRARRSRRCVRRINPARSMPAGVHMHMNGRQS